MPDVSVIIVSWNTQALLRQCIQSIIEQTVRYSFEIIVVDNNSADGSADMVREVFPGVILIVNADNRGFAAANNQGIHQARGKALLLINPDTLILDGAIDRMLDHLNQEALHPTYKPAGIITCKLLNGDYTLQESVNRFYSFFGSLVSNRFTADLAARFPFLQPFFDRKWDYEREGEIDWAYGAVMLFSRKLVEAIGVLDERFYIYAEEIDFFMRARKAGFASVYLPQPRIIHFGQSSSRQRRAAMFIQNYKSLYIFLRKHYGMGSYVAYRLRTHLYLMLWYLKYCVRKDDESRILQQVYKETIKWHYSREGWNLSKMR